MAVNDGNEMLPKQGLHRGFLKGVDTDGNKALPELSPGARTVLEER